MPDAKHGSLGVVNRFQCLFALLVCGCASAAPLPSQPSSTPTDEVAARSSLPSAPPPTDEARAPDCGPFGALGPVAVQEALEGRLAFSLPTDARKIPRERGIMDPVESEADETRFQIDRDDSRLVVLVDETFAIATDVMRSAIEAHAARNHLAMTLSELTLPSGLTGLLEEIGPQSDSSDVGVVIASAYLRMPEGTITRVDVLVTPDVATSPSACRRTARALLDGIAPGATMLDTRPGTRALGRRLAIVVPEQYAITHDVANDYDVYNVHPLTPLDQPTEVLILTVGHNPRFRPQGSPLSARVLGRSVQLYRRDARGFIYIEASIPIPGEADEAILNVRAASEARMRELVGILESLRVVGSR